MLLINSIVYNDGFGFGFGFSLVLMGEGFCCGYVCENGKSGLRVIRFIFMKILIIINCCKKDLVNVVF